MRKGTKMALKRRGHYDYLRSTQSLTNRYKSGLGMRLHLPYYSM